MIELLALFIGLAVGGGVLLLVLGLFLVPLILVLKVVGFGLRLVFGAVGLILGGVLFLPLMAIVGGLLLLKLLVLATPLLLLVGLLWLLIRLARGPTPVDAPQPAIES